MHFSASVSVLNCSLFTQNQLGVVLHIVIKYFHIRKLSDAGVLTVILLFIILSHVTDDLVMIQIFMIYDHTMHDSVITIVILIITHILF